MTVTRPTNAGPKTADARQAAAKAVTRGMMAAVRSDHNRRARPSRDVIAAAGIVTFVTTRWRTMSEMVNGPAADDEEHGAPGSGSGAAAGIVGTFIGVRLGGTVGALAGAGMPPYLAPLFERVIGEWRRDQQKNIAEMAETAATTAALGPEDFGERIGKSPTTRLLTATAAEGAAKTAWPPKVRALGRVLAGGLIADDEARIDLVQLALTAMVDLERPHVMLLDLVANYAVVNVTEDPARGIPFQFEVKPAR